MPWLPPFTSIRTPSLPSVVITALLLLGACEGPDAGEAEPEPLPEGAVAVAMEPMLPNAETGLRVRWSPYGQQLPLRVGEGGMETQLVLGADGVEPMDVRLEKSEGSSYFDRLAIDANRDGDFGAGEWTETEVSESRNKFWSSFEAVVTVPATDPETGEAVETPYPLSLWFVEDPRIEEEELVLRFSRDGWMQGSTVIEGVEAVVMVTERVMNGTFARDDSWALAPSDSAEAVLDAANARGLDGHAWLGEVAYRVVDLHPSGLRLVLAPFDPGMTRAEEIAMNDDLAVDRNAPRSDRTVAFLHDFEEAVSLARGEGKALFIDFETTWCGPCKIMDEWVYTADAVVDASLAVVAVKVDGDERLDLKDRFDVTGFPTLILLDRGGEEVRRESGYVNVADMTTFLDRGR